jgi:hypothetical protein
VSGIVTLQQLGILSMPLKLHPGHNNTQKLASLWLIAGLALQHPGLQQATFTVVLGCFQ